MDVAQKHVCVSVLIIADNFIVLLWVVAAFTSCQSYLVIPALLHGGSGAQSLWVEIFPMLSSVEQDLCVLVSNVIAKFSEQPLAFMVTVMSAILRCLLTNTISKLMF
jgi:hypothetical protein